MSKAKESKDPKYTVPKNIEYLHKGETDATGQARFVCLDLYYFWFSVDCFIVRLSKCLSFKENIYRVFFFSSLKCCALLKHSFRSTVRKPTIPSSLVRLCTGHLKCIIYE